MDFQRVNSWLSLTANIGVVAGIVFLGVEVRQNNDFLEAQSRYNHKESRANYSLAIALDEQFAGIMTKARVGEVLTATEETQYAHFADHIFSTWEWEFREASLGRVEMPVQGYRATFNEQKIAQYWEATKSQFSRDFADFIDRDVVGL